MFVSVRDGMLADDSVSPVERMQRIGVDAVEIALSADFKVLAMDSHETLTLGSDADVDAYAKHLKDLAIRPTAFLTARDFSVGDMNSHIAWVARSITIADRMGIPAIRIDANMSRERDLDFGTRVAIFSKGLSGALQQTAASKVALGIENHGFQGNNLTFLLNVFQEVGSDRLGSTLDIGNFYWRGYPLSEVYGIIRILAPHVKHTHAKNIKYPPDKREITREVGWEYEKCCCPLDEGDIDYSKVVAMLAKAGYTGDLSIEDESLSKIPAGEPRFTVLKRDVDFLKGVLATRG